MAKVYKIIAFLLLLGFLPLSASAATLSFSRSAASYTVGSTFSVSVYVNSSGQAMNAASGVVSFSASKIEVLSLSRSGSIFSFWVQEPAYSNSAGTVSFAGIVPSPGYSGASGKLITINFRAKAAGTANLSLSSESVLANDGNGTNIFTGSRSSVITIIAGPATPPPSSVTPVSPTEPVSPLAPTPELIPEPSLSIAAPIITSYPEETEFGSPIKIRGTSYPNSDITVSIKQGGIVIDEEKSPSNNAGNFVLIVTKSLDPGVYTFSAHVIDPQGNQSNETAALTFIVSPKAPTSITPMILNYLSLIILALLALAGVIAIGIFMWHKLLMLIRRHEGKEEKKTLEKSFNTIRDYIDRHSMNVKALKDRRKLTKENVLFLEKFGKNSTAAEDIIIKSLEKRSPNKPLK